MTTELSLLPRQIERLHTEATSHGHRAVELSRDCGRALIEAREQVPHGEWLQWLEFNCPSISVRSAQTYMHVAKHWATIESQADGEPLTLSRATSLARESSKSAEKTDPVEPPEQIDSKCAATAHLPDDDNDTEDRPAGNTVNVAATWRAIESAAATLCESCSEPDVASRLRRIADKLDPPEQSEKFRKPTVADVRDYCREKCYSVDAESFIAHYESKGWLVGKVRMKSWRAACVTWHKAALKDGRHNPDWMERL